MAVAPNTDFIMEGYQYGTLLSLAARTTSDNTNQIRVQGRFTAAIFFLNVTAVSGTNPTLNVYIQNLLPNSTTSLDGTPDDIIAFSQRTSTGSERAYFVEGGNTIGAPTDATLTAGTMLKCLLGDMVRIKWVIGGTSSPTFTFAVYFSIRP